MMPFPVMSRWFTDNRRALLGWSLGISLVVLVYLPLYPSMSRNGALQARVESLPPDLAESLGMANMTDGAGYAQSTVFGLLGMLLLLSAAIAAGARAIAGDEERGGLEITLAHGVSRRRLVLERGAAVAISTTALAALAGLAALTVNGPSDLGLTRGGLVGISAALGGLAVVHGAVALAAGAALGRRAVALGAASAVAAAGYLAHTLGSQLGDGAVARLSPFHWAFGTDPLRNGADLPGLALLALVSAGLVAMAVILLERRDIGV